MDSLTNWSASEGYITGDPFPRVPVLPATTISTEKLVLGYHYRRKGIQEKCDKHYGRKSRIKRKAMRKLKERKKKLDIRWKIANIIVKTAHERRYSIVLEGLVRDLPTT